MTTTTTQPEHIKQLVSTLEAIEADLSGLDDPAAFDILDADFTCGLDGDVQTISLTVTVGGPHIEVDVTNQVIRGTWGSDERTRSIRDSDAQAACERLADYYRQLFNQ